MHTLFNVCVCVCVCMCVRLVLFFLVGDDEPLESECHPILCFTGSENHLSPFAIYLFLLSTDTY